MITGTYSVVYQGRSLGTVEEVSKIGGVKYRASGTGLGTSTHNTKEEAWARVLFERGMEVGASGAVEPAVAAARIGLLVAALRKRIEADPAGRVELLLLLMEIGEQDPEKPEDPNDGSV